MAKVTLYTKESCPFCVRAKSLLSQKGVAFTEHNLEGKPAELEALKQRTGLKTVPQIFIGETLIGGYSDLAALEAAGKLDEKLNA